MRMEQISQRGLLIDYMKHHYAGKDALVIHMDDVDSQEEFNSMLNDLSEVGFLPPKCFLALGYLIIEMPNMLARQIINKHDKGSIRMELFSNGVCIHENR